MKSSKSLLFSILFIISLFLISCRKDALENDEKNNNQNLNSVNSSVSNTGTEKMMEFAAQTPNPYTLQNMQAALSSLAERNLSQCNLSRFVVRTTHKYIKFKPEDSIQFGLLIQDTSLILFDYPMDRKIIRGGTYYRDPSIPVGKPNYQWTCVKVEKALPSGIPFELLSNL